VDKPLNCQACGKSIPHPENHSTHSSPLCFSCAELKSKCDMCGKVIPVKEAIAFENKTCCSDCYEAILNPPQ